MSFVYAEKNIITENEAQQRVSIFSDTKTTLTGPVLANWCEKEIKLIERYGFIKSVIVGPSCCISFAGNNTIYAAKLLIWIFEKRNVTYEELIEEAMNLHMEAKKDDIEFIICSSETGNPVITCIKNGALYEDVSSAWIGSTLAFQKIQELRNSSRTSISLFTKAIEECGDDSVGGFVILSTYNGKEFIYPERLESSVEKPQLVKLGESIMLCDNAENGGYTVHFRESNCDVIMDFAQIDVSVMYTSRYRYESNVRNELKKHLMLPMEFCTSTCTVI